jgi:hypothetical protein
MVLPPPNRFQLFHCSIDGLELFHLATPIGVMFHR